MRFSERYGYKPVREIIQKESISEELRNRIWSSIYSSFLIEYEELPYNTRLQLIDDIYSSFLKKPLDSLSIVQSSVIKDIRVSLFKAPWYEIYDFLEFILNNEYINQRYQKIKKILIEINNILTEENSSYRIIRNQIIEITSEQEIQSIEDALKNTNPYSGVQQHLNQALKLLSDRQSSDYRNSIIEDKLGLHPALKASLSQLYGYTSDADGIRHAMLEESNLSYIDAKFMLVACTNFINYLIGKTK
ncbi:AbiJ-NTD4 domain-containing protein [Acinetobacter sp. ANC 5378]|uniref:AbiJ-NTD4 domain-containing protein n=1 Tax=Acinetobacter sp. ANC 5378 TaxID=2731249 RepID=UPI0014903DE7|nr:hypothetical protein [Acinetobacter sp. ANC 5378]NNG82144.1 hypothetical protein [Acinetobacter sp. ANC 5378]